MRLRATSGWVCVGFALLGCQARPVTPAASPAVVQATPVVITPTDETPEEAFERARRLLAEGRARDAALLFDQLATHDEAGAIAPYAFFNAGLGWEQSGDPGTARERFSTALRLHPDGDVGKWAALRVGRLCAAFEQWSQLSAIADGLLARGDLDDVERLETFAAKALSLVESGDVDAAERSISKGRDIIEKLGIGAGGKVPLEAAELYFALGEARRIRSEAIRFVPVPPHFADVLEQRCQGLLDAQSAYSDAMRSYDARWAAMSGYRVGELYQKLYADVMAVPPPRAADTTEKKRLFQAAMRLRYRVLLQKGLTMMEHTILVGTRTGEDDAWIERARAAERALRESLREQTDLIAQLPYSEKELQLALDDLSRRAP
jgi:hypothetical protein